MKFLLPVLLLGVSCTFAQMPAVAPSAEKAPAPDLRPRIYDLAGVLGNEGFKFRDGAWIGCLQGGKPQRLAVNLFAGNQYWFCGATSDSGETPSLSVRDPSGHPVETVDFGRDGIAAVGVTAAATGCYTLEIKGSSAGSREFCLLYLFK
jgi:hypothetical protein